jgi:hypothetical protein
VRLVCSPQAGYFHHLLLTPPPGLVLVTHPPSKHPTWIRLIGDPTTFFTLQTPNHLRRSAPEGSFCIVARVYAFFTLHWNCDFIPALSNGRLRSKPHKPLNPQTTPLLRQSLVFPVPQIRPSANRSRSIFHSSGFGRWPTSILAIPVCSRFG